MKIKQIRQTRNHERDVWDKTVKVEQNNYFWHGDPLAFKPEKERLTNNLNIAEMFSGCGGISTGFSMAGFDVILGSDIHKPSVQTFRKNHPEATALLADVKKLSPDDVYNVIDKKEIDVFVAGVPCQGFSINNRKRWDEDERNFLFLEFIRFVKAFKPKAVLLENVSGLTSTANGAFVEAISEAIEGAGDYQVTSHLLNAADYGVPQFRQRIFFAGVPNEDDFSWPEKTHGPDTNLPHQTVWDAISDLPSLTAGEEKTEYEDAPRTEYQRLMRKNAKRLTNHKAPSHPTRTIKRISSTEPGTPMYDRFRQRIRLDWEQPSPTQVAGGIRPQFQFGHPSQARGLTVRERCRMQSFPDNYIIEGGTVQARVQTGNAVPPLLAKAVATSIKNALKQSLPTR